jgi:hypothetical protein
VALKPARFFVNLHVSVVLLAVVNGDRTDNTGTIIWTSPLDIGLVEVLLFQVSEHVALAACMLRTMVASESLDLKFGKMFRFHMDYQCFF